MRLFTTLHNYKKNYLAKDLIAGVVMAAVSIPIAMGYAEVSGLPAVYGLYGSVLPILLFACFSTSPQFIFGVGCRTGSNCWRQCELPWNCIWICGSNRLYFHDRLMHRIVVVAVLCIESRKDGRFYIDTGYGGFCQRHCCDDHFDADTKGTWCFLRNRGASGTIAPFMENYASREWDVSSIGVCFFADSL